MADYRKMWEELGMDLETHDQLCAVLPQAFGDVYLSQENRPESMDYYNMVVADIHGIRPAELIEHQKKGGKVFGTFCVYVPDEIVFAAGGIATGLCGGCHRHRFMRRFPVLGARRGEGASHQYLPADQGFRGSKTGPYLSILPDRGYLRGRDYLRRKEESLGDPGGRCAGPCHGSSADEAGKGHQSMGR